MPLYDLRCEKCDRVFEVFIPLKLLDEIVCCPECAEALVRLFSAPKLIKVD